MIRFFVLFVFFLLFVCVSLAATGYDKFLHYSVSYTAYGTSSFLLGDVGGFLFTAAIGMGKELWDLVSGKGTPEVGDLIADLAGIAAAFERIRRLGFRPFVVFHIAF